MTKLPTSPEALRRLARALEDRAAFNIMVVHAAGASLHLTFGNLTTGESKFLSAAMAPHIREHWSAVVAGALADFDKEVLLAHAAVQDSMEETS